MAFDYLKYIRQNTLPHIWCPGCGDGIITKALLRSIDSLGIEKDNIVVVSGIGCASRLPGYLDFNTLHTTHGRALAFATGIKMAKPELTVIVVSGDGDALAIGGNHFIHACRRNIDISLIIFNNYIYGMTGGQFSPTTPKGAYATTTPYGNPENGFDVSKVAEAAGATFVARGTAYHATQLERFISDAIKHKGFSVVEVITNCHIGYGRRNKFKSPVDMLKWQKDVTISVKSADRLSEEELSQKIITGVLVNKERPEYCEIYKKIIEKAMKEQ